MAFCFSKKKSAAQKHHVGAYRARLTEETRFFIRQHFSSQTSEMRCLCATELLAW